MLEELAQLPPVYGLLLLGVAVVIAWRVALTWWKVRQAEQDHAFKMELLAQNYPIADIERLLQSGKSQAPLLMVSFPTAPVAHGTSQLENVPPSESTLPTAGGTPASWMSFGDWYEQRFGRIPVVIQVLIWLFYGYLWIPACYLVTRPSGSAGDAQAKSVSVLPAFVGAALFVATLFPSISLLVHVSSTDSKRVCSLGEILAPERWVIPVEAGQEGVCRIVIGQGHFAQGGNLEVTAMVIAQSNPAGKLRVETKPGRFYVYDVNASSIVVNLHAGQGIGDFTVQVTALDRLNKRATTVFTVQVRPPVDEEGPLCHD